MGFFAKVFGGEKVERIFVISIKHEGYGLYTLTSKQQGSPFEDLITLPGEAISRLSLAPGDIITVGSKKIDKLNSRPLWIEKNGITFNFS